MRLICDHYLEIFMLTIYVQILEIKYIFLS